MKILVTGANGYIGRHVVCKLLDQGHEVTACDVRLTEVDKRATLLEYNILSGSYLNAYEELGSPDVCLHMAWRDGFVHNSSNHMGDVSNHYKFMCSLIDGGLKQLAVMGTMHEVGYYEGAIEEDTPCYPISPYGIAKDALRRSIQLYAKSHDCILQWIRAYYIVGDDLKSNSIFAKIRTAVLEGKKRFPFTSGKNKYDFIEIEELALQISAVITQKDISGIINCCSGKPMSLGERVEAFLKENNLDISLEYGVFPDRDYDSPCVYGNDTKIRMILSNK
ncbi:NAD-dependent epimerase/dehydratase family protein [Dysgonomonas sp. Marseille-Q5470]|uniref:NAD-dependent epimerase/dehydratase family protein n=1 Tax=Dysgonomonas sp. Marseille-Q5470 TaxID=3039494 RepID=UPI0024BCABA2|nr:NAD-dependent epimerase/dehydratase family protein [Dysgonomonas sp. Marseille-Q5470]MBS5980133.1 NAD-dependent epimerase/dehydratase family protein [Dysgonomonas mossii]